MCIKEREGVKERNTKEERGSVAILAQMDVGQLLALAGRAGRAPAPRDALPWIRRFAVSRRRDRLAGARLRRRTSLHKIATHAHIQHINKHAHRIDDKVDIDRVSPHSAASKGQGKWKQLTKEEVCRCTFSPLSFTMSQIAARVGSSARYIIDLLFMVSMVLTKRQSRAVAETVERGRFEFVGVVLQWDETKFKLIPKGEKAGKGTDLSTLAAHGRVVWSRPGEEVQMEELTVPLVGMSSTSASCMFPSLRGALPPAVWRILSGDFSKVDTQLSAILLGSDHAASNLKLIAHLQSLAGPTTMFLPGLCKQHASGLCLGGFTKK